MAEQWIRSPSPAALQCIRRATTEPLALIGGGQDIAAFERAFAVRGARGTAYNVTIAANPRCECPDFVHRRRFCKHIVFVLLRAFGVPADGALLFQRALGAAELLALFNCSPIARVEALFDHPPAVRVEALFDRPPAVQVDPRIDPPEASNVGRE